MTKNCEIVKYWKKNGDVDRCVGTDQVRGTIVIKGKAPKILPSFKKIGKVKEITLINGEIIKGKSTEYR